MAIGLTTSRTCQDVSSRSFYHSNPFTFFLDFQNKFSAIHQEHSVSNSRELKSKVILSSAHLLSDSAPSSTLYLCHRYQTDCYDHPEG